jgi:hypothetical protein
MKGSTNAVIKNLPNSITNETIEKILLNPSNAAEYKAGEVFICSDEGIYKKGYMYLWTGETFEDITPITSSGGVSGGGIKQLVGTQEKPINLATDMEVGKSYNVIDYIMTDHAEKLTSPYVIFTKLAENRVYIQNAIYTIYGSDRLVSYTGSAAVVYLAEDGKIQSGGSGAPIIMFNGGYVKSQVHLYAPTSGGTVGQILQSTGSGAPTWVDANFEHKLIKETYNISNWTTLSDAAPYTYSTTITAIYTIGEDTEVELINDNAILFAKYGFAIASVNGQEITIYSVTQPSEDISLTIGFRG